MCKFVVFFHVKSCGRSLYQALILIIFFVLLLEENLNGFKHGNMALTTLLLIAEGICELVKIIIMIQKKKKIHTHALWGVSPCE